VNLPNSITLSRILCIPALIWLLASDWRYTELLAALLFVSAALTDFLDGHVARRRNQVTTMGMLLDPVADKLLIAAALISLVQYSPDLVPAWVAIAVIGREFLVSGLRSIAAAQGLTIEASDLGKFKMVVQIVAVTTVILAGRYPYYDLGFFIFPTYAVALASVWFMVTLSLVSAVDYFAAFWSKIDRSVKRRPRRRFILSRRRKRDVPVT
jgi:CDP-diacylglycerol---glycerol-3-phosphate 3-phosphatidyltransferase